ncbi:hypothetical protein INR49_024905 [Caranx melampygus]|nr:hypothetical protein INR49_024905 [Caranx melampygus]
MQVFCFSLEMWKPLKPTYRERDNGKYHHQPQDAQAVDHGGVRVGPHHTVREDETIADLDDSGQILQIDLVDCTNRLEVDPGKLEGHCKQLYYMCLSGLHSVSFLWTGAWRVWNERNPDFGWTHPLHRVQQVLDVFFFCVKAITVTNRCLQEDTDGQRQLVYTEPTKKTWTLSAMMTSEINTTRPHDSTGQHRADQSERRVMDGRHDPPRSRTGRTSSRKQRSFTADTVEGEPKLHDPLTGMLAVGGLMSGDMWL